MLNGIFNDNMDMDNFPRSSNLNEEAAFLEIIKNNKRIISKLCYFYANSMDEFKDLQQDVLAEIWEARNSYAKKAEISTWIYRITLNTCISALRKRKRRIFSLSLDSVTEIPEERDDYTARLGELHGLIGRLNSTEKAILLLWLDEMPYENIAKIMGVGRNTLATRLRRIKGKLIRMSNE